MTSCPSPPAGAGSAAALASLMAHIPETERLIYIASQCRPRADTKLVQSMKTNNEPVATLEELQKYDFTGNNAEYYFLGAMKLLEDKIPASASAIDGLDTELQELMNRSGSCSELSLMILKGIRE